MREALAATKLPVRLDQVSKDLFATNHAPLTGYRRMLWLVGKWDQAHWPKTTAEKARELTIANQLRERNPDAPIRILVCDLPLTHNSHGQNPRAAADGTVTSAH